MDGRVNGACTIWFRTTTNDPIFNDIWRTGTTPSKKKENGMGVCKLEERRMDHSRRMTNDETLALMYRFPAQRKSHTERNIRAEAW